MSHEEYLYAVRELACDRLNDQSQIDQLMNAKLVYGYGHSRSRRGVTCFKQWEHKDGAGEGELVEICASGEENPLQLAGTVLHELAHVLAGVEGKHGAAWKEQCRVLGLRKATARTTSYDDPEVWEEEMLAAVTALEAPQDGKPSIGGTSMRTGKTCGTGQKTQSTRLLLWECHCMKPVKLRAAKSDLHALCMDCGQIFSRPEGSVDAEA